MRATHQENCCCAPFRSPDPADAFWDKQPVVTTTFITWVKNWDSAPNLVIYSLTLSWTEWKPSELQIASQCKTHWMRVWGRQTRQSQCFFSGVKNYSPWLMVHPFWFPVRKKKQTRSKRNGNCTVLPENKVPHALNTATANTQSYWQGPLWELPVSITWHEA